MTCMAIKLKYFSDFFLMMAIYFMASSVSFGQLVEVDQKLENCLKNTDKNVIQLDCIEEAIELYQNEINVLYTSICDAIKEKNHKKQFIAAQKQWNKFKLKEYEMIDGYIKNPVLTNTFNVLTSHSKLQILRDRTGNLMDYYSVIKL